jgi:hypothetical protein
LIEQCLKKYEILPIIHVNSTATVKKKGTFWNLKKRFGRLQKVCKCVESSKKRIKKNSEPFKDLTVYPSEDPFLFETFLSFVDQEKGFVGKYETFRVSY